MSAFVVQRSGLCVKPERMSVRAACFVSASGRLRGEIVRAKPAVQAFRACKGSGWQNGKWLLMARINLFDPGGNPEYRPEAKAPRSRPTATIQPCFGA
jgi:hypothetical protein